MRTRIFLDKANSDSDAYIVTELSRTICFMKINDCNRGIGINFVSWDGDNPKLKRAKYNKFKKVMLDFFENVEKDWI